MDAKFEKQLNWRKIDPLLAVTISDAVDREQRVKILLETDKKPAPNSIKWMQKLGVRVGPRTLREGSNILTADITLEGVRRLSQKPYIVHMSESRQFVPANRSIRAELV